MKRSLVLSLAFLALPLFADEVPTIAPADIEAVAARIVEGEGQIAPAETGSEERPPAPAIGELSGRIDSISEALAEAQKALAHLNRLRFSGYIQPQYQHDERSVNEITGTGTTRNLDQFSVRRARLKITYRLRPTSRFVFQPDITTSGAVLKDGYVEYTEPWTQWKHTVTAGQFNWPFGFEIMYSSSSREMPERTRMYRTLFPGERDRGVMLSGLGFGDHINYRIAVVNGTGTTQSFDFNKRKDIVGRLGGSFGPIDGGVSIYRGSDLVPLDGASAGREFDKERQGFDFQYLTPVPGLAIRGEYLTGRQAPAANAPEATARSSDGTGWNVYVIQNVGVRHQFVLRADQYDPDTDAADSPASWYTRTIGGAYIFHWDANSKVMLAYEKPVRERQDIDDDAATVRYQYSF